MAQEAVSWSSKIRSLNWPNGSAPAMTALPRRSSGFAGRLIGLARTELDIRLRRKLDPEDVVQSVYRSFFTRYHAGQFDVANWDSLWSLLTRTSPCGSA